MIRPVGTFVFSLAVAIIFAATPDPQLPSVEVCCDRFDNPALCCHGHLGHMFEAGSPPNGLELPHEWRGAQV